MSRSILITFESNQRLIKLLSESGARFLVIGGTAMRFHAPERREPNDLDLLIEPSEETAQKVLDAVGTVVGRVLSITPRQLARPSTGFPEKFTLNVDVMTPYMGFSFSEHWALAEEATMAHVLPAVRVRVAAIESLLVWLRHALAVEPKRADSIKRDIDLLEGAARQHAPP